VTFYLCFEITDQKVVEVFSKSLVLNPSKWVHILRSVIRIKFAENMSMEILASKFLVVMGLIGVYHTQL